MAYTFDPADPTDSDAFSFDLSAFVGDGSIASGVTAAISPAGPTIGSVVSTANIVTVWLSGLTALQTYTLSITFRVLDAGGALARGPLKRSALIPSQSL